MLSRPVAGAATGIAVLGMHRSGTSALTRMISLLGADLPARLMQPKAANNAQGFWESHDVYLLNDRLLKILDSRWDDWMPWPANWCQRLERAAPEADTALEENFPANGLFVLKDPRLCRLLPFWQAHLDARTQATLCVLPFRHPREVVASLIARDQMSAQCAELLWLRSILEAERHSRGKPRAFVDYTDLLKDWRSVAARLRDQWRLDWPRDTASAAAEIDQFLGPGHRHHRADALDSVLSDWSLDGFAALRTLCTQPEEPAAMATLDRISAEFDRACGLFGHRLQTLEARTEELAQAKDALATQILDRDGQLRNTRAELVQAQAELESLRGRLPPAAQAPQSDHPAPAADPREDDAALAEQKLAARRLLGLEQRLAALRQSPEPATAAQPGAIQQDCVAEQACYAAWNHPPAAEHEHPPGRSNDRLRPPPARYLGVRLGLGQRLRGWRRARQLIAAGLFDPDWYRQRYADVAASEVLPYWHWALVGCQEGRQPNPLFEPVWYRQRYPDAPRSAEDLLWHFYLFGARERREPGPLFTAGWYLDTYPDVAAAGINPLAHYLRIGWREGRNPNPFFDARWYTRRYPESRNGRAPIEHYLLGQSRQAHQPGPAFDGRWYLARYADVAASGQDALAHFLRHGLAEGRLPNPWTRPLAELDEPLQANAYFSPQWYLRRYPDVARAGLDPLAHYLRDGRHEGRSPNLLFDHDWYVQRHPEAAQHPFGAYAHYLAVGSPARWSPGPLFDLPYYLERHPDVGDAPGGALAHFLAHGAREGRQPHPLFDVGYYCAQVPELSGDSLEALDHYLTEGHLQGLNPCPLFRTQWYRSTYPQVVGEQHNPLLHYLQHAHTGRYQPNVLFESAWYLERYPEVALQGLDPLLHYLRRGEAQGLAPGPCFEPHWYRLRYAQAIGPDDNALAHYWAAGADAGFDPNPLFADHWYRRHQAPHLAAGDCAFEHYMSHGAALGLAPSRLLDVDWYRAQSGNAKRATNPLRDYLEQGEAADQNPNPWFDNRWYQRYQQSAEELELSPVGHYRLYSRERQLEPSWLLDSHWVAQQAELSTDADTLLESFLDHPDCRRIAPNRLFDCAWYLDRNPAASEASHPLLHCLNQTTPDPAAPCAWFDPQWYAQRYLAEQTPADHPLAHFLREGRGAGHDPHPLFDGRWYRAQAPDFAHWAPSPVEHYLRHGADAGLNPHPLFDGRWYRRNSQADSQMSPWAHYLAVGQRAGADPHPLFDSSVYLRQFEPDAVPDGNPLVHFVAAAPDQYRDPTPWFAGRWYLDTYPDVRAAGRNPLLHYLSLGETEGRRANLVFDGAWYRDVHLGGDRVLSPLSHYAEQGHKTRLDPGPYFDVRWYRARYPDTAGVEPLLHFLHHGQFEQRDPNALFDTAWYRAHHPLPDDTESVFAHFLDHGLAAGQPPGPLFDPAWYAAQAAGEIQAGQAAFAHYMHSGRRQDLSPHPWFDAAWYRQQRDAQDGDDAPVAHFLLHGARLGLDPCPLFDTDWYSARHLAAEHPDGNPLLHFLASRRSEAHEPNAWFDCAWYRHSYPDVAEAGVDPVAHYLRSGAREGRSPGPNFDALWYRRTYPDAATSSLDPLSHYLRFGLARGYLPRPGPRHAPTTELPPIATYPGALAAVAGQRNVLICAHAAQGQLFGGERSFLDLLDILKPLPFNVYVCVPDINPDYQASLQAAAVEVIQVPYAPWTHSAAASDNAVAALKAVLIDRRIDLVHVNTIVIREPVLAARALGIPVAVHVRESVRRDRWVQQDIGLSGDQIIQTVCTQANGIIANSATTAEEFAKPGATFVVPNTFDLTALDLDNPIDPSCIRVGLISSNLPKKGIEDFALLAAACARPLPQLEFLLIGPDNDHVAALRERQQRGELPPSLKFVDYQDRPEQALARVNLVMSLSHFAESFGRTVAEALAARRPVIVYDLGTPKTIVTPGENGYVIPCREWLEAVPLLKALVEEPQRIVELGEAGRASMARRYDRTVGRKALSEAYAQLLTGRRTAAEPDDWVLPSGDRCAAPEPVLRLAYFCWHFPVPSETFVLNELAALIDRGIDVKVYCKHSPHPQFQPEFAITWQQVDSPEQFAEQLRQDQRSLVHAHFVFPTVTQMVWPACEQAGLAFTCIAHAQDIFRYQADRDNRLDAIAASPRCQGIFVLSEFHRRHLLMRQVPGEKILINPNCLDTDAFAYTAPRARAAPQPLRLCAIARLTAKKGLLRLLQAAHALRELPLEIHIYGEGPEEASLRAEIARLKLSNTRLMGPLAPSSAVLSVLRSHDLFICPAVRAADGDMDGVPTALLEAMAAGVPVVATGISGIPELLQDGVNGFVCAADDAEALARAIRRALALTPAQRESLTRHARSRVLERHARSRLSNRLIRHWQDRSVDIVIVSWNNLSELSQVVAHLFRWTRQRFTLTICDNASDLETRAYLCRLQAQHGHVSVVFRRENSLVGPGTNVAMAQGRADYVIYVCGKEGFALSEGWETDLIDHLEENPETGLAGTLCHSPSYLHGADYAKGIALFDQFRQPEHARDNPRVFRHVQGGLFILRRAMLEQIGGFNPRVPHAYTDVEYSHYAQSQGWALGEVPSTLSLYHKTRPGIWSRLHSGIKAIHSPTLDELARLQQLSREKLNFCNICHWSGRFIAHAGPVHSCPQCGSTGQHRTLLRYLAESLWPYRQLPTWTHQAPDCLQAFLTEAFAWTPLLPGSEPPPARPALLLVFDTPAAQLAAFLANLPDVEDEILILGPADEAAAPDLPGYGPPDAISFACATVGYGLDPVLRYRRKTPIH